jgi:heme exporter protein CcmD
MNFIIQTLNMGGYAAYVWPAYGLLFTVFTLTIVHAFWQRKRVRKVLQQWFKNDEART